MSTQIICADVLSWAKNYEGPPFHALFCDPPYHLYSRRSSGEKDQSGFPSARSNPSSGGFMGKKWDGGDITFQPETWSALAEHLHPGAFLFVFAGSRGWHRLACALEDAGLVIQPSIFVWGAGVVEVPPMLLHLQAQAFPKATRIDTAIDKMAGIERTDAIKGGHRGISKGGGDAPNKEADEFGRIVPHIVGRGKLSGGTPATPLARAWEGHRYGGQILKDAATPIIVAQKPWTNPRLDCIVETGAGSLWIEGARIRTQNQDDVEWCDCDREAQG